MDKDVALLKRIAALVPVDPNFHYRSIAASRLKRVAEGKARLAIVLITQAIVYLIGLVDNLFVRPKGERFGTTAVLVTLLCLLTVVIGELGRRQNRVKLLAFYWLATPIAVPMSVACSGMRLFSLLDLLDAHYWETSREALLSIASFLGCLAQILTLGTTPDLITSMSGL